MQAAIVVGRASLVLSVLLGACVAVRPPPSVRNDAGTVPAVDAAGGSGGSLGEVGGGNGGAGTGGAAGNGGCVGPCTDFPAEPVIIPGAPADAATQFGAAGTGNPGTGPCLLDPQSGTLFPSNWLRPRFSFKAPATQTLFEVRVHSDRQKNDLVVYTTTPSWTMPKEMWRDLAAHVVEQPITVTVRGIETVGGTRTVHVGAASIFLIAPVQAAGSIVYWTTTGVSSLKGFVVGDEKVTPVLTPAMVGPTVKCIGCHTSTPDGQFISMAANLMPSQADPASIAIRAGTNAMEPPYLTAVARQLLSRPRQPVAAFSAAHWKTGDRIALSMFENANIIWTDLEATSAEQNAGWGIIARTGDTGLPTGATWSHDGKTIVYTSVTGGTVDTGIRILSGGRGSLYAVPYGDKMGGAAAPVTGANDPLFHAYYPSFSSDDRLIAFTRAPSSGESYDVPRAEVFVVNRDGAAAATRLAANDPPQCSGKVSPGVTNSWPKWGPAPTVRAVGGKTYYWLTFSSKRSVSARPQIYITAVVVDAAGKIETFPALYVWNQPELEANHTPAWDLFEITVQ